MAMDDHLLRDIKNTWGEGKTGLPQVQVHQEVVCVSQEIMWGL